MKKIASLILCLMLGLFVMAGCGSEAEPSPYAGTWTATTASYSGIEMPVADLLGSDMVFVLENGGKCTLTFGDESESGKWKETENGFSVEDTYEFVVDGETASMESDGVTINFSFEAAAE